MFIYALNTRYTLIQKFVHSTILELSDSFVYLYFFPWLVVSHLKELGTEEEAFTEFFGTCYHLPYLV